MILTWYSQSHYESSESIGSLYGRNLTVSSNWHGSSKNLGNQFWWSALVVK